MAGKPDAEALREGALERALVQIEKQFGKGAVMRLGADVHLPCQTIPTGSLSLDIATGVGGIPRGRVIEIFGPESSGKTTLALHAVASAQAAGGVAAFIDAEHALDPGYARRLGVNVETLLVSQPDSGEQALEICDLLVRSNAVDLVAVDSVAALVPQAELDGEMGDAHMGLQARLMSQAMRKLTSAIHRTRCAVLFINQLRMRIGVMFGNPETTSGGRALKFYASMRLDVRRVGSIKQGEEVVGNRTRVTVVKNKVAPPFRRAEFDILYNEGISLEGDVLDLGIETGLLEKSGTWISRGAERLGQGRDKARLFLKENPAVRDALVRELRARAGLSPEAAGPRAAPEPSP
ncbi:MAG: recombinase RecA [Planctomycetota bacterium]